MKTALVAPIAIVAALLLGGCSGESEPQDTASTSATASAVPTDATSGVISPVDLPGDPEFVGASEGVIGDVEVASCDTEPGKVEARGTVTNAGGSRRDIAVTMSWTVGATGDVVAKGIAALDDVAPGATRNWVVRATVPGSTTAACVPSAQAGKLKG